MVSDSNNNDENCSVVSGAGSVAARCCAARLQQLMHSSGQGNSHGNSNDTGSSSRSSMPTLRQSPSSFPAPPGATMSTSSTSSTSGSARSRMRMRMQASSSSSPVTPSVLTGNYNSPATRQPSSWQLQHQQNGRLPPQKPPTPLTPIPDISAETIDREVNMALSEFKLSHADIMCGFHIRCVWQDG